MIKFFRKIRKELVSKNRLGKYLIYAIGEIVLVVIGILIALNLNNQNEQRKTEARVELIFEDIMTELISDIKKTEMPMYYWAKKDSTIYLVLNKQVTKEDYEKNEIHLINNLTGFWNSVGLTQNAYDILIQDLDAVQPKFKPVLNKLDVLYKNWKWAVEDNTKRLSETVKEIQQNSMKNYPWYSSYDEADEKDRIDYMLKDFHYRNEVQAYRNSGIFGQLRMSIIYRQNAIECYQEIAKLLNKPLDHESFMFDSQIADSLIGDWYDTASPEEIITFFLENNRLYVKNNFNSSQSEVFYLPRFKKLLFDSLEYATFVGIDDNITLKLNSYDLKKVED